MVKYFLAYRASLEAFYFIYIGGCFYGDVAKGNADR